jgi:hypothetical protein
MQACDAPTPCHTCAYAVGLPIRLDTAIILAPNPEWVKTLPCGKLPDRKDFMTYDRDLAGRVKVWNAASRASQQLADKFGAWLVRAHVDVIKVL